MSAAPLITPIGPTAIDAAREYFVGLHTRLGDAWASLDPGSPQRRDEWTRPAGDVLAGNGRLSLIENGATFDRAGVAFSDVSGAKLPAAASERHTELAGQPFRAMGTSVVVHPVNPYAPTSHANVRLFTARGGEVWWFGGGFDLTPVYPFDEDARAWHQAAKAACDPAGSRVYAVLKEACDRFERQYVVRVLERAQWNVSRAARQLGVHRNTVLTKLAGWGIQRPGTPGATDQVLSL